MNNDIKNTIDKLKTNFYEAIKNNENFIKEIVIENITYECTIIPTVESDAAIIFFKDITNRLKDNLTDLYNRDYVVINKDYLEQSRNWVVVTVFDLDNLKPINDNFWHNAWDEALIKFADILKANSRSDDIVARVGWDEFWVIFLTNCSDEEQDLIIKERIDKMREAMKNTTLSFSEEMKLEASMWFSSRPKKTINNPHVKTIDELISEADDNMYNEKSWKKRNSFMKEFWETLKKETEKYKIPEEILLKVFELQSNFDRSKQNKESGTYWLSQISKEIWKDINESYWLWLNIQNPNDQIIWTCFYLRHLTKTMDISLKEAALIVHTWLNFWEKDLDKFLKIYPRIKKLMWKEKTVESYKNAVKKYLNF